MSEISASEPSAHSSDPSDNIVFAKQARKDLDDVLQRVKREVVRNGQSAPLCQAQLKIQEAIMWLGMRLKELGTENPYPQSYNPESRVIEPTADGIRL